MKNTAERIKIVWATMDSSDGERTLKQHAFKEYQRGKWYEAQYPGNKTLCGNGGVHDGDKFVNIDEIESEEMRSDCCQNCLKLSAKLKSEYTTLLTKN